MTGTLLPASAPAAQLAAGGRITKNKGEKHLAYWNQLTYIDGFITLKYSIRKPASLRPGGGKNRVVLQIPNTVRRAHPIKVKGEGRVDCFSSFFLGGQIEPCDAKLVKTA